MRSMVLSQAKRPLELRELPIPKPLETQVLIQVKACGVCRTDLHIFDGELEQPKLPLIMGHQIVGIVRQTGAKVQQFQLGQRVGVPWLGKTCGYCPYCQQNRENLCDEAKFTGYNLDGGYAEYTVADAQFCFPLADNFSDLQAAPLLCAGLIGYRSYKMTGNAQKIGFYGFGAAAHILIQVANYFGKKVYAFTRQDGEEFLALAPKIPIRTQVNPFPLEQANEALEALRQGQIDGSVVLTL